MYLTLIVLMAASLASVGCAQTSSPVTRSAGSSDVAGILNQTKMKIKIGTKVFDATLFDNPTADSFRSRLPLTLEMEEFNGNEKKFDLSNALPTDASNPKTINKGDLMVWGNNTVVLFYKTFPTPYSYTPLGRVDDPAELESALGKGDVRVNFEME